MPFPIEKAPSKKITTTKGGVQLSELLKYPVRGLVFEGGNTLKDLSNVVADSCICLQETNVPYNVLISDSGKRIFLFPQVSISGYVFSHGDLARRECYLYSFLLVYFVWL